MPTKEEVMKSLETVLVPGAVRSLVKMNLVRSISVADAKIDITLASAALAEGTQGWLKDRIKDATGKLDGVNKVNVSFVDGKPKELNEINNVVAVMSGKGG